MHRIKQLRKQQKLGQADLAKKFNSLKNDETASINFSVISKWENGNSSPKVDAWNILAKVFNVSVPYLQGAYSKEEILKVLQDTFYLQYTKGASSFVDAELFTLTEDFLIAKGVIPYNFDNLTKNKKLVPKKQVENFKFWQDNFKEVFNSVSINWLITKPSLEATKQDIQQALAEALAYQASRINNKTKNLQKREAFKNEMISKTFTKPDNQ